MKNMPEEEMQDLSIYAGCSDFRGVRASVKDTGEWLKQYAVCPALESHQILSVAVERVMEPYRIVRKRQSTTFFLACMSGEGRVWIDGEWRRCAAGMACLLPVRMFEAFHAAGPETWDFCSVCYSLGADHPVFASASAPVLAEYDCMPLYHAVEGLRAECLAERGQPGAESWADLIHALVLRFASPEVQDDFFSALWQRVDRHIHEEWSLKRLTQETHCCEEKLRQLCHTRLGRSPVKQIIHLRMRRAAELLAATDNKIETVALKVGYRDPCSFSTTFKKWTGLSPAHYRELHTKPPRAVSRK
ncbi:MAG: AraC family transcriptional regulator [bacterium]